MPLLFLILAFSLVSCAEPPANAVTPVFTYRVVNSFPHDRSAYTQGLFYLDGILYEGTGLNGRSSIRKVKLETGEVLQFKEIPSQYFGEGIAVAGSTLVELTWQNGLGFVYDRETFQPLKNFRYPGEGWGLTTDGKRLIFSDGTNQIRFLDPQSLEETGRIAVTDNGRPVASLNELEFIKGEIWANIYMTERIARIDPATGKVNSYMDMTGLLPPADSEGAEVLNGIAYDAKNDRIFVTGKLWPKLFEIKVEAKR